MLFFKNADTFENGGGVSMGKDRIAPRISFTLNFVRQDDSRRKIKKEENERMEKAKKPQRTIEIVVAVLLILLLVAVAAIKLINKDLYCTNATLFQTLRIVLYAVTAACAAVGLVAFIVKGKDAVTYGFLAVACLCMVCVQGFSVAGEFENQGKTLQDALYAIVYLMLAGTLFIMCAMESPKKIFRVIVIGFSFILFLAATVLDYGYLMGKAGRITSETEGIVALAWYLDEIVVLLIGAAAVIHEISALMKAKKNKGVEA